MATLSLSQTIPRPSTVFKMDAFYLDLTISRPTLAAVANDWSLDSVISQPTLTAVIGVGAGIELSKVISRPYLVSSFASSDNYVLSSAIKRPRLVATFVNADPLSLSLAIRRPLFTSFVSGSAVLSLSKPIVRPVITANWLNDIVGWDGVTYALNTFNVAHTEYSNYSFNSFFKLNGTYYGISDTGIYSFGADTDDDALISAEVHVPISSYGKHGMKACTDAILLARLPNDVEVVVVNDEQEETEGFIVEGDNREGLHRIRVKIHKGLKGAVWQYKIRNVDGGQFAINSLEVYLKELQRVW